MNCVHFAFWANSNQWPSVPIIIPRIMIKFPMAFVSLIGAAPRWDNACLYDSDKLAVPFVSSPIRDSWHSDAVFSPWCRYQFRGKKEEKKKKIEKVDGFAAAGRRHLVRAKEGWSESLGCWDGGGETMLFLLWLILFEYMHAREKSKTPKGFWSKRLFSGTFGVDPQSDQFQRWQKRKDVRHG